ncbi:MAG: OmpA family protein [Bryobacterales bacterium]|nr:OmpA family protein [Bryobacterales bacterium]
MDQQRQAKWKPPVFLAVATLLVAAAGVVLWNLNSRVNDLQGRLSGVQQRATEAEQDVARKAQELTTLQGELAVTRERATRAENLTEQLDATNRESESQVQQLREESEASAAAAQKAAAEKQQALEARQQALGELESMVQRRQSELDRMQQALNQVAPTVRTPSGMVMQLADDSFKFDFDSAALKPANREVLSRIAGILLASEGYRLFIDGHTDDTGTDAYNQQLSERRTGSVRDYMVKAGVPANSITVKGFGKSNPLVSAKTQEARAKNRRVEIGIVDTIIDYQTTAAPSQ